MDVTLQLVAKHLHFVTRNNEMLFFQLVTLKMPQELPILVERCPKLLNIALF